MYNYIDNDYDYKETVDDAYGYDNDEYEENYDEDRYVYDEIWWL